MRRFREKQTSSGWRNPQRGVFWRLPPYLPDVVAPVATFGRGSPTGVVCYRHQQFPEHYRGGFFLLDWTFGRVFFVRLDRSGSSYTLRAMPMRARSRMPSM